MVEIDQLSDDAAQQVLFAVVRKGTPSLADLIPYDSSIRSALAQRFDVAACPARVSAGDLAREALQLFQEDPNFPDLVVANSGGQLRSPIGAPEIAVATAALFALRTQINISRDKQGKWTFNLKVKSLGDSALKPLLEKLIAYLP